MKTEIEAKFLKVNFGQVREKLAQLGATCVQPMRLMRRAIIEPPELAKKDAFLRVRDEGDKVTLTYKQFDDHTAFSGVQEIEVTVSDFEATVALLDKAGLSYKSLQESRRETWKFGDEVEVVLDEWPWLSPYIEIEGASEEVVRKTAAALGFDWADAVFGSVTVAYQAQYPQGDSRKLITLANVAFDAPVPAIISGKNEADNERA